MPPVVWWKIAALSLLTIIGAGVLVLGGFVLVAQDPVPAREIEAEVLAVGSSTNIYGVIEVEGEVQAAYVPLETKVGERIPYQQRLSDGAVFATQVPGKARYPGGWGLGLITLSGGLMVAGGWGISRCAAPALVSVRVPGAGHDILGDDGRE